MVLMIIVVWPLAGKGQSTADLTADFLFRISTWVCFSFLRAPKFKIFRACFSKNKLIFFGIF